MSFVINIEHNKIFFYFLKSFDGLTISTLRNNLEKINIYLIDTR